MKRKKESKQAISLIVLVITIIVMIILAGAVIISLSNSGIIDKASQAVSDMNEAQMKELVQIAWGEAYLKVTDEEKTDDWYYNEIENDLKEQGFPEEKVKEILETSGILPSIDKLQEKHEFKYYSSLSAAVSDVNAETVGVNADSDKSNAVAGIYVEDGKNVVVLLKDTSEANITLTKDATLNLGGNTITADNTALIINGPNVTIDGRISGSTIVSNTAKKSYAVQLRTGTATIKGGTYLANATESGTDEALSLACAIRSAGNLNIQDATLKAEHTGNGGKARALDTMSGSTTSVSGSELVSIAKSGVAVSIYNYSLNASIIDCDIRAYSDYNREEPFYSQGVANYAEGMYLENCYVMGTHSGLQTEANIVVKGGTYESYCHGGIYFTGANTTHYVQDAKLRECKLPSGYVSHVNNIYLGSQNAGFYIGGEAGMDNIKVYMDNCDIYATRQFGVLRATGGEKNNTLYISNSRVDLTQPAVFSIDPDAGHKIYIGKGCNFTAANVDLPELVVSTEETYVKP